MARRMIMISTLALLALVSAVPAASAEQLRVRKSVTDLSATERSDLVTALHRLKAARSPHDSSLSWYDQFVAWHKTLTICSQTDPLWMEKMHGHAGPVFLPWHRQFVLMLEDALNAVSNKKIAIPFWDWTDPASRDAVFASDFMGKDGNPERGWVVTDGPFAEGKWQLNVKPEGVVFGLSASEAIVRRIGFIGQIPTATQVAEALEAPRYDVAPWDSASDPEQSFRNAIEGFREQPVPEGVHGCNPDGTGGTLALFPGVNHNAIHPWVGGVDDTGTRAGTMTESQASPNDPVFFLHHAMIDRVWAQWQDLHPQERYAPGPGVPHEGIDARMEPWWSDHRLSVTPGDVEDVRALGYVYAGQPARMPERRLRRIALRRARAARAATAAFCRL